MSDLTIDALHELLDAKICAHKEYFETLLKERDRRYEERFQAQLSALHKVELQTVADKAQSNEWRAALSDSYERYASREALEALAEKVSELQAWRQGQQGEHEGAGATRGQIAAAVGLLAVLLGIIGSVVAFL